MAIICLKVKENVLEKSVAVYMPTNVEIMAYNVPKIITDEYKFGGSKLP